MRPSVRLSREGLEAEAAATGFRPEVLEKVLLLLDLLEAVNRAPELSGKLALKGGTALNLFLFDDVPRLSVDIDLNYVGAEDRETALKERPEVERTLGLLARRLGLTPQTPSREHAGTGWSLRYASALGGHDNIKVDINYLYRVPLWPPARRDSRPVGARQASDILVLDDHELAAGKLAALLARRTSRDLFDAHELLTRHGGLDRERLRLAFVLYGAMNIEDWRKVSAEDVDRAAEDLDTYLLPLLRANVARELVRTGPDWGARLADECRAALLASVLPLDERELRFLERLLAEGELEPERLTGDADVAGRARRHPALLWKRLNVRKHFGLGD